MDSSKLAFVVIAEFQVKPGRMPEFLAAARDDASHSVVEETGCRQFDIICPQGEPDIVVFYEVYKDRAAFDVHLQTEHVDRFRKAFPALIVEERPVRFSDRHYP
ncbi:putative quinol monooxygenase [Oryzifoliimicrobium ureilyticus]|uniref:putative quinol monooxygenase n=1 Tax=Oryzifoliimicrobium ureilyticus TaxID=3113724 RepID=UPI003076060E